MNWRCFGDRGFVRHLFERAVEETVPNGLVSGDHFSADGTPDPVIRLDEVPAADDQPAPIKRGKHPA